MAKEETTTDPYVAPKRQRDHAGLLVRTAVIGVIAAGLAVTGYLMSTQPGAQFAALQPEQAQQSPVMEAPAVSSSDNAPPQAMPAEPMTADTPPALPPAADPAEAIPEIQPSSPPG